MRDKASSTNWSPTNLGSNRASNRAEKTQDFYVLLTLPSALLLLLHQQE